MRVTLVHNPGAGDHRQPSRKALLAMIRAAGYTVHYCPSHDLCLAATLRRPTDLVVIAGGRRAPIPATAGSTSFSSPRPSAICSIITWQQRSGSTRARPRYRRGGAAICR